MVSCAYRCALGWWSKVMSGAVIAACEAGMTRDRKWVEHVCEMVFSDQGDESGRQSTRLSGQLGIYKGFAGERQAFNQRQHALTCSPPAPSPRSTVPYHRHSAPTMPCQPE